ncbi:hypothetical protein [Microcoleus sp. FACHB-672]|uniref:hypothetical protein n=1 Tax=Microcoleus sp. FACHB-672 TaxID=2692825 RepID=UPI001685E4FD|nr:hypothetical protein [Microcoleus sp. FACHB-672]MBD2039711.1 hypothetical protein [Microcoleus sp. FACHB-672]
MWLPLGTLSAALEWQSFDEPIIDCSMIRVSFATAGSFDKIFSFCWLRRTWIQDLPAVVEPAFKVYPKAERILYSVTIPEPITQQGLYLAEYQLKLGFNRRNFSEPAYSVSLEGWI